MITFGSFFKVTFKVTASSKLFFEFVSRRSIQENYVNYTVLDFTVFPEVAVHYETLLAFCYDIISEL